MAAVETRHLTKRFGGFTSVDDLSLEVRAGEVFGLLGSNGAGKSTTIRMLCGLLTPTSGEARVLDIEVARHPEEVKRRIGYMTQRFSLYQDLTVRQNIRFFGGVYGLRGKELEERESWAAGMAGLEGKEDRLTRSLPGGWKQRLALACALLHQPKVVFLDEPTAGVDPISRRRFWNLIDAVAGGGATLIVTTHYLDEAERCDRIALMHGGRLIALGSVEELKEVFASGALIEVSCPRLFEAEESLGREDGILEVSVFGTSLHVVVRDPEEGRRRVEEVLARDGNLPVTTEAILPSLEDVFIHSIEGERVSRPRGDAGL